MRGIGCLLTGIELFPGNIQGGSDTPGRLGQAASRSTRRSRTTCRSDPATRTRFGSLEFGVHGARPGRHLDPHGLRRAEQADRADRRPVPDVRQALRPDEGPGEPARASSTTCRTTCKKVGATVSAEDRQLLEEHATFVREMEQELQGRPTARTSATRSPSSSRASKDENDNIPQISKMQIDLMVNSFAADFARVATLQYTNSVGEARMRWLGVDEGHHELSHKPDSDEKAAGEADQDQQVVLRAARLPGASGWPRRPSRAATGSLLDNTLIVWTNELGKGNSHTLDNIPFVLVGNGLDFKMGRSLKYPKRAAQPAAAVAGPRLRATASSGSATPTSAATARSRS